MRRTWCSACVKMKEPQQPCSGPRAQALESWDTPIIVTLNSHPPPLSPTLDAWRLNLKGHSLVPSSADPLSCSTNIFWKLKQPSFYPHGEKGSHIMEKSQEISTYMHLSVPFFLIFFGCNRKIWFYCLMPITVVSIVYQTLFHPYFFFLYTFFPHNI